jgi:hypothetical protein
MDTVVIVLIVVLIAYYIVKKKKTAKMQIPVGEWLREGNKEIHKGCGGKIAVKRFSCQIVAGVSSRKLITIAEGTCSKCKASGYFRNEEFLDYERP